MGSEFHQLHFLLVPLMSQSHIIPLTDFAKLLVQHGLIVSIITTPLNTIRHKAAIDHLVQAGLKIQMIPLQFPSQDVGLPQGCENMDALTSMELAKDFFVASEMLHVPLEKLIGELEPKPNCIISTNALPWTQRVAQKFNIPRYVFETISCFTLLCSGIMSRANVLDDMVSDSDPILVPDIPHKIEFTKAQLPESTRKTSSDDIQGIIDQIKQAQKLARGTLANTYDELEPFYVEGLRKERENVWCIGPVSLCNKEFSEKSNRGSKASIDEHFCIKWLDSMKPNSVIYACFGSLCHISFPQLKEIGLGLEECKFPFIWIIRGHNYSAEIEKWLSEERFQERVEGRGLIIPGWAPQVLILSHPSVGGFLTHCGWNSTLEGVSAGVPMITWPMFSEQFYNENFIINVLEIGVRIGVKVRMKSAEEEAMVKRDSVKKAIEKVMGEGEEAKRRRERARKLGKKAVEAMEEGGSSYKNITLLIQDVVQQDILGRELSSS
ncbi:UDP-glycosyltransferase 73C3 [Forsythia ovata]|uniref:Glycosyltransferase n=1 Tax=Forsythia ovata TaxID=205694 RepID=A0ABD1SSN4_9LAMI